MPQDKQAGPDDWRDNPESEETVPTAFVPTEVRIFTTDPPRYEFDVDGTTVTMSVVDLVKPSAFQARCLAVLHRMIDVPHGKGSPREWQGRVNAWLATAKRVELSEDSSPVMFERAAVLECLESLQVADAEDGALALDFRRGCVVVRDGKAHISLPPLLRRLRADFPKMGPDDLGTHLRKLKWMPSSIRFGQPSLKSWRAETPTWSSMPWASQISEAGS